MQSKSTQCGKPAIVTEYMVCQNVEGSPSVRLEAGVSSASAARNGGDIVIVINLAAEIGTADAPAEHNNGIIGNPAVFFAGSGTVTVGKVEYTCVGSTVKLTVGQDGYVRSASYSVPLHIVGEVSVGAISGEVTIDGVLNELWDMEF